MPYWTSMAISLRVVDYGETSQIAAFLTRDKGRVSAIAKGAKRKGSRFSGALEPVTLCEVVCFKGRDTASLHTLAELDVRDTYRGARQEMRRLHAAAYVIEVLREVAPEEQPLPDVFDLAAATLRRISTIPDWDGAVVLGFEARLLELMGLFPLLDACVECGEPAGRGAGAPARAAFSARLGGVLCEPCQSKDRHAKATSPGALQTLAILGRDPAKAAHLKVPPGQQAELRALLNAYLAAALDRDLRLAKYL